MKTFCVAVVGILLAGPWACRAQVTAFPVKLTKAAVTLDQSEVTTTITVGRKWLVGDGNRLVLVIDQDNHALRLDSVDANNEFIATLAESTRVAILVNGVFGGILEFESLTVSNGLFSVTGDGAVQIRGRVHSYSEGEPVSVSAQLVGVLNDSVTGNPDAGDVLIKGKMLAAGHAFDATGLEP
jgi:hypothetical protein